MRSRLVRRLLMMMLGLALLTVSACGEEAFLATTGQAGCTVTANNVHPSGGTLGSMGGKVRVECNAYTSQIVVYVWLERWTGTSWAQIGSVRTAPYTNVKGYDRKTGQSFIPCALGTYRTRGYGKVTYRSKVVTLPTDTSAATDDPCS